jgi:hypothetical protein
VQLVLDTESEMPSEKEILDHLDIGLRRVKEDLLDDMKYHVLGIHVIQMNNPPFPPKDFEHG